MRAAGLLPVGRRAFRPAGLPADPTRAVVECYRRAVDTVPQLAGRNWYAEESRSLWYLWSDPREGRGEPWRPYAVAAALAPRIDWGSVRAGVQALAHGRPIRGRFLSRSIAKAKLAAHGDVVPADLFPFRSAPKSASFFQNLSGNYGAVTVDTWSAALVGSGPINGPRQYWAAAEPFRRAGDLLGVSPALVQARTWSYVRDHLQTPARERN